jgi:hypothetical protein
MTSTMTIAKPRRGPTPSPPAAKALPLNGAVIGLGW